MSFLLLQNPSVVLKTLKERVRGDVLVPGDAGYAESRASWNLTIDHSPSVVVVANDAGDVQAAVDFARERGLPVAVQSTGHGQPRVCTEGVLINTSRMNSVTIDPERRVARVGAGACWNQVLTLAQEHDLLAVSGSATHIGVVGYTLGGGYGLLSRELGLAIDSVVAVRIVTADGELRTASRDENPDLFWALRGAGGGLGVVTEIEMALHKGATVFGGMTVYPAEQIRQVVDGYLDWLGTAPESVATALNLMNLPPLPSIPEPLRGRQVVAIAGCTRTNPEALDGVRNLGEPIVDTMHTMPYAMSGAICQDPVDPMPARGQGVSIDRLTPEAMDRLLAAVGPLAESPNLKIEIRHLGGAISRAGAVASPIDSRRRASHFVYLVGVPVGPNTPERLEAQAKAVYESLGDRIVCPGTINFLGEGQVLGRTLREVFEQNDWTRLVELKRTLDPENLFRYSGVGLALSDGVAD